MSLAVKNLDYEIGNERILDQISLEIKEGEFVGLVGPNGCGKSTLLKHIYRTYKPKGQTVFLDGKDIMDLSAKKLAGELAVMAQENQLKGPDRKSTRLNSSHIPLSRMPSSA